MLSTFHIPSHSLISHNYIPIIPHWANLPVTWGRNCTKATKQSQRNPLDNCHPHPSTMENDSTDAPTTFATCPSDRRKHRASLLRSKRLTTSTICKSSSHIPDNKHELLQITTIQTARATCYVEDRKTSRKLRNRASALASRNKRNEEIDALTLKLGKLNSGGRHICNHPPNP